MSEPIENEAAEGEEVVTAEAGEGASESQAPQDDGPSAEDRAMAMGWTPKAQFKGDPERWVDAETFIKRGEEFLPFLKANNKRLEQALERANRDIKMLSEHHSKTAQREYQRAMNDIQARLDDAAANGDVQGVRDATDELVELSKEVAPAKPAKDDETDQIFEDWKAENPWYGKDTAMTAAANAIGNELFNAGITGKAQATEVTKRIKAEFPHKFENPNRRSAAAVEGGGASRAKASKTRSDLPADARAFMDRMVKQGLMTEAQYLKEYQW